MVPTIKHPDSVMLWGIFSGDKERGGLYFLLKNEKMKADLYVKVLEEHTGCPKKNVTLLFWSVLFILYSNTFIFSGVTS